MGMNIHDHFDGSAHCIECAGPCRLEGEALLATKLIRFILEQWAVGYSTPNMLPTSTIKESGIDFENFKKRAKETS